ncbi:solute carrier family 26 member 6 [Pleuronectes platessa]|uniref:solute carrier family 26 member 6 n=1 Tax=Pleuronectes platessa TaxID=8262 RepID=UPI00232A32E2|nr:solute carrier family 26 member 6 [Pleuronectes platessa]
MGERWMAYSVHRKILDEGAVDDMAGKSESKTQTLSEKVKKSMRCSAPRLKSFLLRSIPLLSWLPRYSIREYAIGDLIAGISVGILHLPFGMSTALVTSVPPIFGLYTCFYPVLIYFIFGTSKHISMGPYTVVGVMIGGVADRLIPNSDFMIWDNVTNSSIVDTMSRDAARVQVAAAVTFLSGVFQILLGLAQFGFLVTYLSEPLVRGYTTGTAFHIIVSQLKYVLGINPVGHSGLLSLIYTLAEVCYLIPQTNIGTLVVSVVTIVCLVVATELNACLSKKLPVPIPMELLALIIGTFVSWQVNLEENYGVDVMGLIPSGLQPPVFPDISLFGQVIGDAFAVSVVGYSVLISLGRIFALKYGYQVDSSQELIALGLSNSIGGMFQCLSISGSMSRTAIQERAGGKTQAAGALSAIVSLFIMLWIGALFKDLPKAVLAAIIYVTLHSMLKQFLDIPVLWRKNKIDAVIWAATFIFTLLLNSDIGLAASIGFSILTVIFRTQLPKYSLLGQVPGTDMYRPLEEYKQVRQVQGILIFRSSATLYFANAEMYQDALGKKIQRDYGEIGIEVVLAGCQTGVVDNLQTGGFFDDKMTKSCLFSTIHDAVLFCQSARMEDEETMETVF